MLDATSQCELALRDTLLTRAESWAFDELATRFGFERPPAIHESVWRHALRTVAYGARGTLGNTWAAVELGFRTNPQIIVGTIGSAGPHQFLRDGALADNPEITCNWICRFVRLRYSLLEPTGEYRRISKILYTTGFTPTTSSQEIPAGGPYPANLSFAPVETGYWTTEDTLDPLVGSSAIVATLELLPFMLADGLVGPLGAASAAGVPAEWAAETGVRCVVALLISEELLGFPASYLLEPAGVDRSTLDPLMPLGSQIMDMFGALGGDPLLVEAGDPLGDGPYPIYWADPTALSGFATYFDPILAAGVDFDSEVYNFCLFPTSTGFFAPFYFAPDMPLPDWTPGVPLVDPVSRLTFDATGRRATQVVWPAQSFYVFSGGAVNADRVLQLTDPFPADLPLVVSFVVGQGHTSDTFGLDPADKLNGPGTGDDLVFEYSTDGGGSWGVAWTGIGGSGSLRGSLYLVSLPLPALSGDYLFRWRMGGTAGNHGGGTDDEWALSYVKIVGVAP